MSELPVNVIDLRDYFEEMQRAHGYPQVDICTTCDNHTFGVTIAQQSGILSDDLSTDRR